jgi:hypothetical protein
LRQLNKGTNPAKNDRWHKFHLMKNPITDELKLFLKPEVLQGGNFNPSYIKIFDQFRLSMKISTILYFRVKFLNIGHFLTNLGEVSLDHLTRTL